MMSPIEKLVVDVEHLLESLVPENEEAQKMLKKARGAMVVIRATLSHPLGWRAGFQPIYPKEQS